MSCLGRWRLLKAYVAYLPGAADVDLAEVRRAARDTGPGLTTGLHPSTHVNDTIDDIYRLAAALLPATEWPWPIACLRREGSHPQRQRSERPSKNSLLGVLGNSRVTH
jgi:hypothetical protein